MTTISLAERQRLATKYPAVFQQSFLQRWGLPVGIAATLAYLVFCWFFFSVGPALQNGKWDRASIYIQDWYSWRAQPRLRFADGVVTPQWSSRGQYAEGAEIDWLTPRIDGGMTATFGSADDRLEISTTQVDVYLDGTVWPVSITEAGAFAPDNAPSAIEQDGSKVLVNYGFAEQA